MKNWFARSLLIFVFFLSGWNVLHAQDEDVDSLKLALKNATQDSTRCEILVNLTESADDDEWPAYNEQLKKICEDHLSKAQPGSKEAILFNGYYAEALNNVGCLANQNGDAEKALEYYKK